jgi:hypothetical protein
MAVACPIIPRTITLILGLAMAAASATAWAKETIMTSILSGLEEVQNLRQMDNGRQYELEAKGTNVTGFPDDFLRRRTPAEILKSGLSCGCGDYAFAFYFLIESRGFHAIYIDAVALNYSAIEHGDSGHTGVAVKDDASGNWILVDPTSNKIISADWNPTSTLYEGPVGRFWIGYKGSLDKYPVADHAALRVFYAETLRSVPKEVWEKALLAFDFAVDDSLKTKDGAYSNPNMEAFLTRPAVTFRALGIQPSRRVKVTLKSWDKKTGSSDVIQESDGSWTCFVQDRGRMSASLTDWITAAILRKPGRR